MSKLSRRRFVATGLAGAGASALPIFAEPANAAVVTRYNLKSVNGQAMLKKYAQAVKLMVAKPPNDPLSWQWQWYTHAVPTNTTKAQQISQIFGPNPSPKKTLATQMWDTCQGHFNPPVQEPYFCPWHRMYLCFFEAIIRKVLNDNTFSLPYWNYSVASGYPLPQEFRMQNDPVWGPLYRPDRRPEVNNGQPIFTNRGVAADLNPQTALNQANYLPTGSAVPGFNRELDQGVHGNVHVFVGNNVGMGRVPWAANDPIFWMHHCNIDRIWASWNNSGHTNPTTAAWSNKTFTFASAAGTAITGTVKDYTNTTKCQYKYDALIGAPVLVQIPPIILKELPKKGPGPVIKGPLVKGPIAAEKAGPAPLAGPAAQATTLAAPAAQGPVELGAGPVRVNLRSSLPTPMAGGPSGPLLSTRLDALPEQRRLYLVLSNLRAAAPPETLFRVYLDLPEGTPDDPINSHYVGSFNFFEAVPHGEDHAAHAAGSNPRSFDITMVASNLKARGALKPEHTVTIVPAGQPAENAKAVVGDIAFIEQ